MDGDNKSMDSDIEASRAYMVNECSAKAIIVKTATLTAQAFSKGGDVANAVVKAAIGFSSGHKAAKQQCKEASDVWKSKLASKPRIQP